MFEKIDGAKLEVGSWKLEAGRQIFKLVVSILIFIVFLTTSDTSLAQRFEGGLLAGFNASQVEGDTYKGYHKPGLIAGAYVQTDLAPAIFAAMEIKYAQKGARNKPIKNDPTKYVMRLGYIDIPAYVAFRTNDRGAIIAGISTGFLIHAKEYDNYGEYPVEDQSAFNTIDLQALVGFQFDFLDNIKVDLRFALSVIPIRSHPGETPPNQYWISNQFNNVISLALYYRFDR